MPIQYFAFDVFGTLVDTKAVAIPLAEILGDKALAQRFSELWREKQLEYTFRRALMRRYETFTMCSEQALVYTARSLRVDLSSSQQQDLVQELQKLPAFLDVVEGLLQLGSQQHRLAAFSNGVEKSTRKLLDHNHLLERFADVISVDELQTFKPDPSVYSTLLDRLGSGAEKTWVVSSNPFDVIGAKHMGLRAAWVQRGDDKIYDPWGVEPDLIVPDLVSLANHFLKTV